MFEYVYWFVGTALGAGQYPSSAFANGLKREAGIRLPARGCRVK